MKISGRIMIILAAFAIVMGITYVVANAVSAGNSSTSANMPAFERGDGNFSPPSGGERPEFRGGEGREFRGEAGGIGWIFGFIKNTAIITVIVALITIPKSIKRRKIAPVSVQ